MPVSLVPVAAVCWDLLEVEKLVPFANTAEHVHLGKKCGVTTRGPGAGRE